jgi:hypothetical protein
MHECAAQGVAAKEVRPLIVHMHTRAVFLSLSHTLLCAWPYAYIVRPMTEVGAPAVRSRRVRMAAAVPLLLVGCSAIAVKVMRSRTRRKLT